MFARQERPAMKWAETAGAPAPAPAGMRPLPRGQSISIATNLQDFAALEGGWRALEAEGAKSSALFQTYDWLSNWIAVYNPGIAVVTGHHDGRLVFAWPLMKTEVGPLTVLRWLSEPLAQYGDVLLAGGQDAATWMARGLEAFRGLRGIDSIRLRHVRDDAVAAPFLAAAFRDARMNEQAPWLDLSQFSGEAAYEARYTSNQRKRRKKIRKSLEDDFGPVNFELLDGGPLCDATIAAAVAEKCLWLDTRGRHNRAFCNEDITRFLQRMARGADGPARLVASRLTAGGREVSWEIGFRHRATHFGFITAHDNALTDYSAARLHMDLSQRQALKDGMTAFDLMVPNDAHKDSWCSAKAETRDYHLPLTALGRLYGIGYLETARPLLRRAYYGMPTAMLRALKPIIGH